MRAASSRTGCSLPPIFKSYNSHPAIARRHREPDPVPQAEGSVTFNKQGIVGVIVIALIASIGIIQGGWTIFASSVLIVLYGAAILAAKSAAECSASLRSGNTDSDSIFNARDRRQYAEYRVIANIWLGSLHLAALLTAGALLLEIPGQPLLGSAAALVALPLSFALAGHSVTASPSGPVFHPAST